MSYYDKLSSVIDEHAELALSKLQQKNAIVEQMQQSNAELTQKQQELLADQSFLQSQLNDLERINIRGNKSMENYQSTVKSLQKQITELEKARSNLAQQQQTKQQNYSNQLARLNQLETDFQKQQEELIQAKKQQEELSNTNSKNMELINRQNNALKKIADQKTRVFNERNNANKKIQELKAKTRALEEEAAKYQQDYETIIKPLQSTNENLKTKLIEDEKKFTDQLVTQGRRILEQEKEQKELKEQLKDFGKYKQIASKIDEIKDTNRILRARAIKALEQVSPEEQKQHEYLKQLAQIDYSTLTRDVPYLSQSDVRVVSDVNKLIRSRAKTK